jgi:MoaA/NifB/PqqE/SkfB family radical SAM enzyme
MRKVAFGYSTRCNIRCAHCVAASDQPHNLKMDLSQAKKIIRDLSEAAVTGISFTAGEPFIYFDDLLERIDLCKELNIFTRVVTNSFLAKSPESANRHLTMLSECGVSQLRLSYSRWHQQHISRSNILNAAHACLNKEVAYFVSFVTDFTEEDDSHEQFLRDNGLKFFPEPVIYAGRADSFGRKTIFTDYQDNTCSMNPYIAPDLTMYACCDAGSHFTDTNFFRLGNLQQDSVEELFSRSENCQLYNCIRSIGLTTIASYAGLKARDIVAYRKCELCKNLFNSPEMLSHLERAVRTNLQDMIR